MGQHPDGDSKFWYWRSHPYQFNLHTPAEAKRAKSLIRSKKPPTLYNDADHEEDETSDE